MTDFPQAHMPAPSAFDADGHAGATPAARIIPMNTPGADGQAGQPVPVQNQPTASRVAESGNWFKPGIQVRIAGRTYDIERLKFKAASLWRARIKATISQVVPLLDYASQLGQYDSMAEAMHRVSVGPAASAASGVLQVLAGAPDLVAELVFEYAPALAADREHIESNAYDEDFVMVFLQIMALAWPVSKLTPLIERLAGSAGGNPPGMLKK